LKGKGSRNAYKVGINQGDSKGEFRVVRVDTLDVTFREMVEELGPLLHGSLCGRRFVIFRTIAS
jgi:hypothetical protein